MGVAVASGDDVVREISRLAAAGVGIIKVMASGAVSLRKPGAITPGGFNDEELRLIVSTARDRGLGVMAHANGEEAIISAAEAGVLSVEHGFFMTDRALDALARSGVFWVPTVGALQRAAGGPDLSLDARAFVQRLISDHCALIGRAWAMGVPLAVGTDAVLPHAEYRGMYEQEMVYFSEAGISEADVIAIATSGGAKLLGL
jgi:imidazolonepropionase-like amidohydrolase